MTKHEELAQLRSRIQALAANKKLRQRNAKELRRLRDLEIQLHLDAVDEAFEAKLAKRTINVHYHERPCL